MLFLRNYHESFKKFNSHPKTNNAFFIFLLLYFNLTDFKKNKPIFQVFLLFSSYIQTSLIMNFSAFKIFFMVLKISKDHINTDL